MKLVVACVLAIGLAIGAIVLVRAVRAPAEIVAGAARPTKAHPTTEAPTTDVGRASVPADVGRASVPADVGAVFAIPAGGFAQWTGREGTGPGELEQFAQEAGLRLPVALEQRRSTLLMDRTMDFAALEVVLGRPTTSEMREAIARHASVLHEATAHAQVDVREGRISDDTSIAQTRAAEDAYRAGYRAATGLDDAAFERLLAR